VRIVLDTNVLVSGLLSPAGPPGRIVDLLTSAGAIVLHDDRILSECREVLARPRLGIAAAEAAAVLAVIEQEGELTIARPLAVELPDPDDLPFLEVAVAGRADMLVTGNERHFKPKRGRLSVPVGSPAEFLRRYK
jgi:uncharacterized protein